MRIGYFSHEFILLRIILNRSWEIRMSLVTGLQNHTLIDVNFEVAQLTCYFYNFLKVILFSLPLSVCLTWKISLSHTLFSLFNSNRNIETFLKKSETKVLLNSLQYK